MPYEAVSAYPVLVGETGSATTVTVHGRRTRDGRPSRRWFAAAPPARCPATATRPHWPIAGARAIRSATVLTGQHPPVTGDGVRQRRTTQPPGRRPRGSRRTVTASTLAAPQPISAAFSGLTAPGRCHSSQTRLFRPTGGDCDAILGCPILAGSRISSSPPRSHHVLQGSRGVIPSIMVSQLVGTSADTIWGRAPRPILRGLVQPRLPGQVDHNDRRSSRWQCRRCR